VNSELTDVKIGPVAYKALKTDHVGPQHGTGAYLGQKKDAKKESNKDPAPERDAIRSEQLLG
jgi:hypothetical protein